MKWLKKFFVRVDANQVVGYRIYKVLRTDVDPYYFVVKILYSNGLEMIVIGTMKGENYRGVLRFKSTREAKIFISDMIASLYTVDVEKLISTHMIKPETVKPFIG